MMYILYYYINILIPTLFLNNSLHKQLYSQYDYLLSTIPFFPFLKKTKTKTQLQTYKKKYYFTNLQNSYFKDIKNLKLNGATILDLSKKQKPETLIVVVKKNQWWAIANLFIHVRHMSDTQAEKEEHEEKILKLLGKRYGVYFSKLSNATFAWWKKHNLEPEWQIIELNISNFHNSKKQNKKTSLLSATNTFFQCKKNKTNKNKNYFCSPPSNYRIKSHAV